MTPHRGMTSASRSPEHQERCSVSRSWRSPSTSTPSSPTSSCPLAPSKPLIFFAYPLIGSLLVLTPGLSHTTIGVGLAILAAGLVALVLKVDRPRWQHEREDPLSWRVSHALPGSLLTTLAAIAAVAMITISIGGLYWLGGAMAFATSAGLINSWVLLVEIKR